MGTPRSRWEWAIRLLTEWPYALLLALLSLSLWGRLAFLALLLGLVWVVYSMPAVASRSAERPVSEHAGYQALPSSHGVLLILLLLESLGLPALSIGELVVCSLWLGQVLALWQRSLCVLGQHRHRQKPVAALNPL